MGDPPPERPKSGQKSLEYLKPNIDKPLPPEVNDLLFFLNEEEQRLNEKNRVLEQQRQDELAQLQLAENKLRILEINNFRKLLAQHADNPDVKDVSEAMNRVYSAVFGQRQPKDFENMPFKERAKDLIDRGSPIMSYEVLHGAYLEAGSKLDDTLDATQTNYLIGLSATGQRDAFFETYATSRDRYHELVEKILHLPKKERDRNIDLLLKTITFYEWIQTEEFSQYVEEELQASAKQVLENQQAQFEGLRGLIQKGIEKGTDFAIDHFSNVFGDKDSVARNLFIQAAKAGRDLSKPIQYEPELVKKLADETVAEIKGLAAFIDKDALQSMKNACVELKANPDSVLAQDAQTEFKDAFGNFFKATTVFQKKLIEQQSRFIQEAYVLSHGERNSDFEADSTLRAKFLSIGGRDLIRLCQLYSPFGIFLPATVERKGGKPSVYLKSAYDQGWFRENPTLSVALQSALLALLLKGGYKAGSLAMELSIFTRFVKRALGGLGLGKIIGTLASIGGKVYFAYELTNELKDIHISSVEKDIFEILNKYNAVEEMTEEDIEEVRILTLRNEIEKRRELFQEVGYDLSKLGMGAWDRAMVANLGIQITEGKSMRKTGVFREAVLTANRKLVLLGLEPFEIK